MKKKNVYLVVMHTKFPDDNAKTSKKDWGKLNEWKVDEQIEIVSPTLKKRHIDAASVIVNVTENNLYKNRFGKLEDDHVRDHYIAQYGKELERYNLLYASPGTPTTVID